MSQVTSRRSRRRLCGVTFASFLLLAAACSSNKSAGSAAATSSKGGGRVVAFIPTTTQNYVAGWARGARAQATSLGLSLDVIENNFDQSQEDSQVRQELASGRKASAYVWWPSNATAERVSLQALHDTGVPVIQTNQAVVPATKQLLAAYAGVDDTGNGKVTGENVVAARDAMKRAGIQLHSPNGNLIIVGLAAGYQAGDIRNAQVINQAKAAGMQVVGTIDAGFDAAAGYTYGSQLITKAKSQGVDIVVSLIDNLSAGVMRALAEQGYTPGKDVYVVSGTCSAGLPYIHDGREYATGIQPAENEGALAVTTAHEAMKGPVSGFYRFMPNQSITRTNLDTFKLAGKTVDQLCTQ